MAGKCPSGYEFNVMKDAPASQNVYANWNTPIIFSGFEIGAKIMAGLPLIHNNAINNNPVKNVFSFSIPLAKKNSLGRKNSDETAFFCPLNTFPPYLSLHP